MPLPFRERKGDGTTALVDPEVLCRFGRRDVGRPDSSVGGSGLGSRAGALRFRDDGCLGWAAGGAATVDDDAADSSAARAADARVVLGDMSNGPFIFDVPSHSFPQLCCSHGTRVKAHNDLIVK